jgi:hypothetical protein
MRFLSVLVVTLTVGGWARSEGPVDLSKLDRAIKKEPSYQARPKYCLLVLGPKAETRVWLVLDGEALYVDTNGNGDLTEPGKRLKVATPNQDPAAFEETEITAADGAKHPFRFHLYGWFALRSGKDDPQNPVEPSLDVTWKDGRRFGAWGDEQGALVFAARPQDAPVVHVGGPLQMGFEVRHPLTKKGDGSYELNVGVGTKGLGKGSFAHLVYNVIPEAAHPKAILEFPNPTPGGLPVRVEQVLGHRC